MALKYVDKFEEGALIDDFLRYLIKNEGTAYRFLSHYVRHELLKNKNDPVLQYRIKGFIRSKIVQYNLVQPDYKNEDTITGLGRDVLKNGGINQWISNEEIKIIRQENRENGMYNINKLLGLLAVATLLFSIYQYVKSYQLETRMKGLEDTVSIIRKNYNIPVLNDSSHLKEASPINKIKK